MKYSNAFWGVLCTLALLVVLNGCENMELEHEKVSVESVTLNTASLEIEVGQSQTLTATISPSDAANQKVIWSTSNSAVATVSDGVVTGLRSGNATITAKSDDGGKVATCEVIVKPAVSTVGPAVLEMDRITATTASFKGHLNVSENAIPFSSVTLYYSDDETFSIGTAQSVSLTTFDSEQNFSFYLTDLKFDTEYSYSLVVKVKSEETYLDVKKFKTNNVVAEIDTDPSALNSLPVCITGSISGLSVEDRNTISVGIAYSQDKGAAMSGTGSEIAITEITAEGIFSVKLESIVHAGDNYFSFYVQQGDDKVYSDETKISISISYFENRLLRVSDIGYDTYTLEIKVPEEVTASGNHVHFTYMDTFRMCRYCECNISELTADKIADIILKTECNFEYHYENPDVTKEYRKIVVGKDTPWEGYYVTPGESVVAAAVEVTPTGEYIGNVEVINFKTLSPDKLNADIKVEITDVTAIDATITVIPDANVNEYQYLVIDDASYKDYILKYCNASDLQWYLTSLACASWYGQRKESGNSTTNLSDWWELGTPNTKYHILITGKGDEVGTSQCFKHVEFETSSKKRTMAPVIEVTPLPEESTHFSAAFNIKCISYDNPASGPVVSCVSLADYVHNWLYESDYSKVLSDAGTKFTADQLIQINSAQGYTMHIPVIDGMELRFGVKGENDENDSSGAVTVDYATPYYKAEPVTSDYLSTDILVGEWVMTATDIDGKSLETTVDIIRSLNEERDYQSGCPSEFIEQVEVFNQRRLADKNSLLIQGWFLDSKWGKNGPYEYRSPYDLLMAQDYNATTYQQLFFAAGPKIFMEVKPDGKLVVISDAHRYMPVEAWGTWLYLGGVSANRNAVLGNYSAETPSQIEFPVTISDNNETLTIEPADYNGTRYYLNVLRMQGNINADILVNSPIVLKKK